MGFYFNWPDCSRKEFLERHGTHVPSGTINWCDLPAGCSPVVLIDNGFFTDVYIPYNGEELAEATRSDRKVRTLFIVKNSILFSASPDFKWFYGKLRKPAT